MNDFEQNPGAIDEPDLAPGVDPDQRRLPPGDTAGDTGGSGEPQAAELDLPGPDDPVAWNYIEPGTDVIGREGVKIGTVAEMLGTEAEGIFHGIALNPSGSGSNKLIYADSVTSLTPSQVQVQVATDEVDGLQDYQPES
jgi:hypothetical protein